MWGSALAVRVPALRALFTGEAVSRWRSSRREGSASVGAGAAAVTAAESSSDSTFQLKFATPIGPQKVSRA
jgi:hypothetical protein